MKTYVYIISAGNFIKVGVSKHPTRRLSVIQTSTPMKAKIIQMKPFPSAAEAFGRESIIHSALKSIDAHVRGEWFRKNEESLSCSSSLLFGHGDEPSVAPEFLGFSSPGIVCGADVEDIDGKDFISSRMALKRVASRAFQFAKKRVAVADALSIELEEGAQG